MPPRNGGKDVCSMLRDVPCHPSSPITRSLREEENKGTLVSNEANTIDFAFPRPHSRQHHNCWCVAASARALRLSPWSSLAHAQQQHRKRRVQYREQDSQPGHKKKGRGGMASGLHTRNQTRRKSKQKNGGGGSSVQNTKKQQQQKSRLCKSSATRTLPLSLSFTAHTHRRGAHGLCSSCIVATQRFRRCAPPHPLRCFSL